MKAEVRSDRDHPAQAARRVARNTAYLGLAEVVNKVMMFIFYLLAARHLGAQRFGVLSFGLAFVTMLSALTDLGLGSLTAREAARDVGAARLLVGKALGVKLVASVLVSAMVVVLVNWIGYPPTTLRVVYICSLLVLWNTLTSYLINVFQGLERMRMIPLCRIVQTGVLAVGAFMLARGPAVTERYALLYVFAAMASATLAAAASAEFVHPWLSFDLRAWRGILVRALPMGLATILVTFYYWNGTALLSKLSGDRAVGAFSAAFRLVWAAIFAGLSFSGALYPLMSRLARTNPLRLRQVLAMSLRYMTLLALPIGALGMVLAHPMVFLVYGAEYNAAVSVLRVLAWWGASACMNSLLSSYFVAVDRPGVMTTQTAVSLAVNLVGNATLIRFYGPVGAAVSLAAAEFAGVLYLWYSLSRIPGAIPQARYFAVLPGGVGALVVSAAVAWFMSRWGLAVACLGAAVAYVGALLLFRSLNRDDIKVARALLRTDGASI